MFGVILLIAAAFVAVVVMGVSLSSKSDEIQKLKIELEHYGDIMTMRDRLYVQNEIDKQRILFLERLLSENGISYNEENGLNAKHPWISFTHISISILHLRSRTETSLKEAGIYYLSQLTSLTFQDVKKIKGIGYVEESEILKSLDAIGLEINDEYDEIDLEDECELSLFLRACD